MDYQKISGEITNRSSWKDELQGKERVLCLSDKTGELLWTHEYACRYRLSFPTGPRCTPSITDGKIYALGAEGNLVCLNAMTGERLWAIAFNENHATETPI